MKSSCFLFSVLNMAINFAVCAAADFNYQFSIDPDLIDGTNNIITFTDESKGSIEFCARVETVVDDLNNEEVIVSFKKTNFNVNFDLSNASFTGIVAGVVEEDVVTLDQAVDDIITVSACLCDESTFVCIPPEELTAFEQNSFLNLCLKPSASSAEITNFHLELHNYECEFKYNPVTFGPDGWVEDQLTECDAGYDESTNTDVVLSKVLLVAGLFEKGNFVNVLGNTFLSFKNSGLSRKPEFAAYEMEIPIIPTIEDESEEECTGLFGQLMKLLV